MRQKIKSRAKIAILVLVLLIVAVFLLKSVRQTTLTGYEDASGWIYECSKPIKAKKSNDIIGLGHPQGLAPVDQTEASIYCHKVGIE